MSSLGIVDVIAKSLGNELDISILDGRDLEILNDVGNTLDSEIGSGNVPEKLKDGIDLTELNALGS